MTPKKKKCKTHFWVKQRAHYTKLKGAAYISPSTHIVEIYRCEDCSEATSRLFQLKTPRKEIGK